MKKNPFILITLFIILFVSCKPEIETPPSITTIFIDSLPAKTQYIQNETLDLDGLIINSVLSDGTIETITDYITSLDNGTELTETGTITITITYSDLSTDFSIEVSEAPSPSKIFIDSLPKKTSYSICDNFDTSGLILKEIFTNGEIKEITDYSISPKTSSVLTTLGENKATITYNDQTLTFPFYVTMKKTGLPTVTINTNNTPIADKENWIPGTIKIENATDSDWNFDEVDLTIKGRGNTSWGQPKKPYAIKLDKKQKIMGMPKHKRWVLIANYLDNSFIKNEMAFYISEQLGMSYTVKGEYVDLILNNKYIGLYWLGEAIKVDENRVNIDEDNDYLLELDTYFDETWKFRSEIKNFPYNISNDDCMTQERLENIKTKIDSLETYLYSPDFPYTDDTHTIIDTSYENKIDLDSMAKFYLVNEIMHNGELGHPKSCYFYFDNTNDKLFAGPVWDFDWATLSSSNNLNRKNNLYFDALFKIPDFTTKISSLVTNLKLEDINNKINSTKDYIEKSQQLDIKLWGEHNDPSNIKRENFEAYVNFVKTELNQRVTLVISEYGM